MQGYALSFSFSLSVRPSCFALRIRILVSLAWEETQEGVLCTCCFLFLRLTEREAGVGSPFLSALPSITVAISSGPCFHNFGPFKLRRNKAEAKHPNIETFVFRCRADKSEPSPMLKRTGGRATHRIVRKLPQHQSTIYLSPAIHILNYGKQWKRGRDLYDFWFSDIISSYASIIYPTHPNHF